METPPGALEIDGAFVAPSFVDVHVHGGAGADFMDGTLDGVLDSEPGARRHGHDHLPDDDDGSPEQLEAMLAASLLPARTVARITGVRLFGPFFAAEKLGCHGAEGRRARTPESRALPRIRRRSIATCAAELPGAEASTAPQLHAAAS